MTAPCQNQGTNMRCTHAQEATWLREWSSNHTVKGTSIYTVYKPTGEKPQGCEKKSGTRQTTELKERWWYLPEVSWADTGRTLNCHTTEIPVRINRSLIIIMGASTRYSPMQSGGWTWNKLRTGAVQWKCWKVLSGIELEHNTTVSNYCLLLTQLLCRLLQPPYQMLKSLVYEGELLRR